jgi:hypothetical protein
MLLRDGVSHHPKVIAAGPEAAWLWVAAIDYARAHLTNGLVPFAILPMLGRFRTRVDRLAAQLVAAGLFVPVDGGYTIHDFLDHNDSREAVLEKRRKDSERKRGNVHASVRVESKRNPDGIQQDSKHLARARERVGVGTGFGLVEGEPEREAGPPAVGPLADDVWQLWRQVAEEHGQPIRLAASHTQTEHLATLARTYTVDDLGPAMRCWWASPHVIGRNIGLFVSQVDEVLAHLANHPRAAFRAPADARQVQAPAPSYRGHDEWHCPHDPHCPNPRDCDKLVVLAAARAAKAKAG